MIKKINTTWKTLGFLLISIGIALASDSDSEGSKTAKVGFVGAQFLKLDIGARGFAMGAAMDPLLQDASSVFWNPAGLATAPKQYVFASKTKWFADIDLIAAAYSIKVPQIRGTLAVSMVSLSSGDMSVTTIEDQDGSINGETFSAGSYAIGLGYGTSISDKFSFGAHVKFIHEAFAKGLSGEEEGFGAGNTWAFDVGTLYDTNYKTLKLGMSIRNFGPDLQLDGSFVDYNNGEPILGDDGEPEENTFRPYGLPLTFRFGVAATPYDIQNHKVVLSVVAEHPADNHERINLGTEYTFYKFFVWRAGYVFNDDSRGASIGVGVKNYPIANFGRVNIDIGMTDYRLFDPTYLASFGIQI